LRNKKNKNIIDQKEEIFEFQNNEPLKNQAKHFIRAIKIRKLKLNKRDFILNVVNLYETSTNLPTSKKFNLS
tara:strand:- start:260 stop:475 length:216 start_codon:yes stop_codon:yes gene_type:complete